MAEEENSAKLATGKLLNTAQAARHLGVTKAAITRLREEGKLPGARGSWGRWYYTPEAVAAVVTDAPATETPSADATPEEESPPSLRNLASIMNELGPGTKQEEEIPATEQAPIVRMANAILIQAIDNGNSDIHIEPESRNFRVRYRIDGILHESMKIPNHITGPLVQRYKVMADINLLERRIPQAGSLPILHEGKEYNLRVTTLPSRYGENVTLHILKEKAYAQELSTLGMNSTDQSYVDCFLSNAPSGLILIAGPSGSGITTTAYNLLSRLNTIETKMVSLEDLPEYTLSGMVQTYYGERFKSSFSEALRLLPLTDTDILFLGDINTPEAASAAVEAALSGKRVLATVAASDTDTALWRLAKMGIPQEKLRRVLVGAIAQRLVRRICKNCIESYMISPSEWEAFGFSGHLYRSSLSRGAGCEFCRCSGYRGRIAAFEIFEAQESYKPASLHQAAEELVLKGLTTPSEIFRVMGILKN